MDLRDHARKKRSKEETDVLPARLPVSKIQAFKQLCDELGLSVSEAIRLMVDDQLTLNEQQEDEDRIQKLPLENITYTKSHQNHNEDGTSVYKRKQSNNKRFTVKDWKMDSEIPCPICQKWTNFKNYARHCKQYHDGITTEEIFKNETYIQIANDMLEQRKER